MSSTPFLENFIHQNYPGVGLPPLWEVIYQEAIRGHHLLFRKDEVEKFDSELCGTDAGFDQAFSDEIEGIVVAVVEAADLQGMIDVIDSLREETRKNLYFMYRRVLWMWRNYVKEQLN